MCQGLNRSRIGEFATFHKLLSPHIGFYRVRWGNIGLYGVIWGYIELYDLPGPCSNTRLHGLRMELLREQSNLSGDFQK